MNYELINPHWFLLRITCGDFDGQLSVINKQSSLLQSSSSWRSGGGLNKMSNQTLAVASQHVYNRNLNHGVASRLLAHGSAGNVY